MTMDFVDFLREMLGITGDFAIIEINKDETKKEIRIHLRYLKKDFKGQKIYDHAPEREWQHLNWFDYRCYLVCSLPRYISADGKPKIIDINFAPKSKGYTFLFAEKVIEALQKIQVQATVAELFSTTAYIVRSIMESAVENGLLQRKNTTLANISLDEKSYAKGHQYATILINSDENCVIELVEGRKEEDVKKLFQKSEPSLNRVNMDMWKPYMNVVKEVAPQAMIVHDKFHLFKKLSDAINQVRKKEVAENHQLKTHKYTVLKNAENRTEKQQQAFETMMNDNLKTAQAWLVRENFKTLFHIENNNEIEEYYNLWKNNSLAYEIKPINSVVATFDRHLKGIINAIITRTSSAKHENMNGKIQAVLAKARGFLNFERFRINALFYFGNLKLMPLKIY